MEKQFFGNLYNNIESSNTFRASFDAEFGKAAQSKEINVENTKVVASEVVDADKKMKHPFGIDSESSSKDEKVGRKLSIGDDIDIYSRPKNPVGFVVGEATPIDFGDDMDSNNVISASSKSKFQMGFVADPTSPQNKNSGKKAPETTQQKKDREANELKQSQKDAQLEEQEKKEALARQEYQVNLKNLFDNFKEILEAEKFSDVFKLLKDDKGLSEQDKKDRLEREFNRLKKICNPDTKGNPDEKNETLKEVREIAEKATAMLESFKLEAQAYIEGEATVEQEKKEQIRRDLQAENKKNSDADFASIEKIKKDIADKKNEQQRKAEDEKKAEQEKKIIEEKENVKNPETEKQLIEELNSAREKFADTEFRDRTTMQRIRKYLNNGRATEEKDAESPNIKSARDSYQTALKNFMEHKISQLQDSGVVGKELETRVKELYSFFNLDETVKYYDARTEAKMTYLAGNKKKDGITEKGFLKKGWDKVNQRMVQFTHWYNKKVPAYVKVGLALTSFVPGIAAFKAGKRVFGASLMAAAGGLQLDKLAQLKDAVLDKHERNRDFEKVSENEVVDFEKLKGILDDKINNIDYKLNAKNLRSGANKFAAFGAGVFLGYAASQALAAESLGGNGLHAHMAHNVTDGGHHAHHSAGNVLKSILVGSPDGPAGNLNPNEVAAHSETLTIQEGGSIEKDILHHLKVSHPEIKNTGWAVHHMFLDYMHDNKEALIKSVGVDEYNKMFKDGMVNIKPGTKLVFDDSNPLKIKLMDIGGKISHLNVHEHHVPITAAPEVPVEFDPPVHIESLNDIKDPSMNGGNVQFDRPVRLEDLRDAHPDTPSPSRFMQDLSMNENFGRDGIKVSADFLTRNYILDHIKVGPSIANGDHRETLRIFRQGLFANANEYKLHRGDNVVDLMKNYKESFSREGRMVMKKIIASKEFTTDRSITAERLTRDVVIKLAA